MKWPEWIYAKRWNRGIFEIITTDTKIFNLLYEKITEKNIKVEFGSVFFLPFIILFYSFAGFHNVCIYYHNKR